MDITRIGNYIGKNPIKANSVSYADSKGVISLGATNLFPKSISRDGLVSYIDFGNPACYPGTGTTVTDLVATRTFTVANSPTFNASGYFVLDGTDDRFSSSTSLGATDPNNFTLELWCQPTATHEIDTLNFPPSGTAGLSGQRYILFPSIFSSPDSGAGISVGTNGVSVYEHSGGYLPATLVYSNSISSTQFTHIVVMYTANIPQLFINGKYIFRGATSPRTNVYAACNLFGGDPGVSGHFQGNFAIFRKYNKPISDTELLTNYHTEKARFGL